MCFKRDIDGEIKQLEQLAAKKAEYDPSVKDAKEKELHEKTTRFTEVTDGNKSDDELSVSLLDWSLTVNVRADEFSHICLNVVQYPEGACVDSGSPCEITNASSEANLTFGPKVNLKGAIGDTTRACAPAEVHFPTITRDMQPVIIRTGGKGLYYKGA
eukprot:3907374-Rhodomonas_salina.1